VRVLLNKVILAAGWSWLQRASTELPGIESLANLLTALERKYEDAHRKQNQTQEKAA
jgi:hypothetical protein